MSQQEMEKAKVCQHCKKEVSTGAKKCPHCQSDLKTADEKFCHECGEIIRAKAEICPKCGVRQPTSQSAQPEFTGQLGEHKCLKCGYQGQMKTWLGNSNGAQFIAIILFLFWIIPGIIFVAYFWNKYKCPKCGAVGETIGA